MKKLQLEEIKTIQLDILKHFNSFCQQNDITYFLSNGTALGAVKYGGYIPWDDDIDVCLLRHDYEKFINIYKEKSLNEKYELFSLQTNGKYAFPFAKLSDTSTILNEHNVDNGAQLGINIDIFPLDGFGENLNESKKIFKKFKRIRKKLYWSKLNCYSSSNPFKVFAKFLIANYYKIVGARSFCEKIDILAKNHSCNDNYIGNVVWGFYGDGEAHEKSVFSNTILFPFEDTKYPIPKEFDTYLKKLYGDYKLDPPLKKQVSHHIFDAYSKD